MKISVVGTGYVGLVTGTCFAELGNDVTCVDIDERKVEMMQNGQVPIYEPGLQELFTRNIEEGRLHFTTDLEKVVGSMAIFLALPTPPDEDGSADLSYILGVADRLGEIIEDYTVVVNKSTVPVGTAELVRERIEQKTKIKFDVVSNPETLKEGTAVDDFMTPDRVIIGSSSDKAKALMHRLYRPLTRIEGGPSIIDMSERDAETVKYAANAYLAAKVSMTNMMARFCEAVGADISSVMRGVGTDPRIGNKFLHPSLGYGGSCFPKDIKAIVKMGQKHGVPLSIFEAVENENEKQKQHMVDKILDYFEGDISGKTFALWGLAFKAKTDDIRESPALVIIDELLNRGANIVAYDPEAIENTRRHYSSAKGRVGKITFVEKDPYAALAGADALVIATEWKEFSEPDFNEMKKLLNAPVIFDGRNLYALQDMADEGFHYESIGRRDVN